MRLLLIVLFLASLNAFAQLPKNLVLEGGGIRGIAYSGALELLDSLHQLDSIERIAGTSSGSMNGLLYAIGYGPKEIQYLIGNTAFEKFNQVGFPIIGGMNRMKKKYGYYSTKRIEATFEKLLAQKGLDPNLTFKDLHELRIANSRYKDLYITGTSLNNQKTIVFSYETYPEMRIVDAMRVSLTVPFYFEAIFVNKDGSVTNQKNCVDCDIMVDGGVLTNYPFFVFDTECKDTNGNVCYAANPNTLGLKLERTGQLTADINHIAPYEINGYKSFMASYYTLTAETINRQNLTEDHFEQTILISNLDMSPKVRKLSEEEKNALIESGKAGVRKYFQIQPTIQVQN
jgi:NTE family protein